MRNWNAFQEAIFRDVSEGKGHTVVIARAGSGKTSTIVESFGHVPRGKTVLMCAFNKAIADELSARAPSGVTVSTLHSYGLRACKSAFGWKLEIDRNKVYKILDERFPNQDPKTAAGKEAREIVRAANKLVSLAKAALASTAEEIEGLADHYDVQFECDASVLFRTCVWVLDQCRERTDVVDFDDMVWLPAVLDLPVRQFDMVFVDETQDLNKAQIELALKACRRGGRIIAVGDDRQAIYQFRGADEHAIPNLVKALKAKTMPLSVTYRCARAIVEVARRQVPDLQAAPGAPEGEVHNVDEDYMQKHARPGDFILSRANAPLVPLCMQFLKEGRRAAITGRDIGASLVALVRQSEAMDVVELTTWVDKWCSRECHRLQSKKPPQDVQMIVDKAECINAFCEGAETVAEVIARMEAMFSDQANGAHVVLSTTHKAKGLERDRAFILTGTYRPSRGVEEANLWYVAVTRAKTSLFLVSPNKGTKKDEEVVPEAEEASS